jgi:hypothetical protein
LDDEEITGKDVPGQLDQKNSEDCQEWKGRLTMLDPESDGTAVRIDQLLFGIGVKDGESREEKKIDGQGGS